MPSRRSTVRACSGSRTRRGDESGRWLVQPFHGGETTPFLDGVPHGWNEGLAQAPGIVVAAMSNRDGFAVYVSLDGASARRSIARTARCASEASTTAASSAARSPPTARCCASSTPSTATSSTRRFASSIHVPERRSASSSTRGCLSPRGAGHPLSETSDSPASTSARATGVRRSGTSSPASSRGSSSTSRARSASHDWWPDGSALLLENTYEGRSYLYRYDLATAELTSIRAEPGYVWKARVRADGRVWFLHEQGKRQRLVLDDTGAEVALARRARLSVATVRVVALPESSQTDACTDSSSRPTTRAGHSRS